MFSSFRAEAGELIHFTLMNRQGLIVKNLGVRDAGQVSFRPKHCLLVGPIEIRAIDGSTQVGQKHAAAFQIQGDTDSFLQMVENNLRFFPAISLRGIHGGAIHGVAAWWNAAVGPVDRSVGEV
jgi:hypothetical protein